MSTTPDFSALLNTSFDDVKKPEPLPAGTYQLSIKEFKYDKTKPKDDKEPSQYVRFSFAVQDAGPDVDQDLYQEAIATQPLAKRTINRDFYITPAALWRLKEFLQDHLGLDLSGKGIGEAVAETTGMVVMGEITQRPSNRPGDNSVYNDIASFAKAE